MGNKEFARKMEQRTSQFAVNTIHLSTTLPSTPESRVVRNQMTRSGTFTGANYREANRARSKADFRSSLKALYLT